MTSKIKSFFSINKKSKYFKFIDPNTIESQVISYNGSIIPLPKEWALQKVHVLFNDGLIQEHYVKDSGNIYYISVAKIYLGTKVRVSLIPIKNKDGLLGKISTSLIYSVLSVYLVAIAFQFV